MTGKVQIIKKMNRGLQFMQRITGAQQNAWQSVKELFDTKGEKFKPQYKNNTLRVNIKKKIES